MIVFEWRAQESPLFQRKKRNKKQVAGKREGAYNAGLMRVLSMSLHFPEHGPLLKHQGKSDDTVLHIEFL